MAAHFPTSPVCTHGKRPSLPRSWVCLASTPTASWRCSKGLSCAPFGGVNAALCEHDHGDNRSTPGTQTRDTAWRPCKSRITAPGSMHSIMVPWQTRRTPAGHLDFLGRQLHVSEAGGWPASFPQEFHDEDVVLDQNGAGRRDARRRQPLQIPHFLLCPHLARRVPACACIVLACACVE